MKRTSVNIGKQQGDAAVTQLVQAGHSVSEFVSMGHMHDMQEPRAIIR